jgi:signal peptidase II
MSGPDRGSLRRYTGGVPGMRGRYAVMGAVVAAVVFLDQLTKSWAVRELSARSIDLFWTLRLDLSFNSGFAFSQGQGLTRYITVLGVLLVAGLVWWSRGVSSWPLAVGLALLIGGAIGNLSDRLFRSHGGAVIDFIDPQWWPVFNVADVAVSCGAVLLVISSFREPDPA